MPVVTNTIVDPLGAPLVRRLVEISLVWDTESQAVPLGPDGSINGIAKVWTDDDGVWEADLVANADITPALSTWKVTEGGRTAPDQVEYEITVPDSVGPHTVASLFD